MRDLGRKSVELMAAAMWFAAAAHARAGSGTQGFAPAVGSGTVLPSNASLLVCVEGQSCPDDGNACTLDVCHNDQCTHPLRQRQLGILEQRSATIDDSVPMTF